MKRLSIPLAACAIAAACADERPPVDRVQPYALAKADFVGADLGDPSDDPEFWTQASIIDVGYGASYSAMYTSSYAQRMSRIRWQITEDLLLARLAYERIEGSDGKGLGGPVQDGVVVAAFRIEKHFDVSLGYNPTTGENLNIVEENDRDRPWYERAYMRVDWSKNLDTDNYDFDTLSVLGVYGGVDYAPLAIDVTDPNDPRAPHFALADGYFDVTTMAFATPKTVDRGFGPRPACWYDPDWAGGTGPGGSCSPVELTVRHSFRRVEDHDYEPVDWDGYRFAAYGGFYVERFGYARNYGMSDDKWHRFLARYQIWQRSHFYEDPDAMRGPIECFTPETTPYGADPHRDEDGDGTEDECATVGGGSRCDAFRQRCTLPYARREVRPVVWYYTPGSPVGYFDGTAEAAHEWDVALRAAVATARYAECAHIGGAFCAERFPTLFGQQVDNEAAVALAAEVDACRRGLAYAGRDCDLVADELGAARGYSPGAVAIAKMPEMLVLCHSPVAAGDHAYCGAEGLEVRRGDLRYHQVNVIAEPQSPSPWGVYSDAEDPLTGETVSASINVWSSVTERASQNMIDTLRYLEGELSTDDVTEGEYVRDWVQAARTASASGALPRLSRAELDERVAGFAGAPRGDMAALPPEMAREAVALERELDRIVASADAASTNAAVYAARRAHAAGTAFEAELVTPMMQALAGVAGQAMTPEVVALASPLRAGDPMLRRDLYHDEQVALADRGACVMDDAASAAPVSLPRLGEVLAAKFGAFSREDAPAAQEARAEKMRDYLARRLHRAVVIHEMGHSVGLRHNFVSSSDAWQYRPQYWQLRTDNGAVTRECTELDDDGERCVGPRWFDPVTAGERDNLLWMFMHSSVMDYHGETTQDMVGLGVYDFAAARAFYGDTVAVHDDPSFAAGTLKGETLLDLMDGFGGIRGIRYYVSGEPLHYSQLQSTLGMIEGCEAIPDPTIFAPATWDEARDGAWDPLLDGLIVQVGGAWTRCRQPKVDHVPWRALRMPDTLESGGFYGGGPAVDTAKRVRMPYGFASDRWADLGNVSVYRHDNGADPYEIFNYLVTQQEIGHIFDNYRRRRQDFSVRRAAERTLYRYNAKLRDGAKGLSLFRTIYQDYALARGYDAETYWKWVAANFFEDNILASGLVFDHFVRMFDRPEIGPHFRRAGDDVLRSAFDTTSPGTTLVNVPNGATGLYEDVGIGGKLVENRLADDRGEFDSQYDVNAGSYYDKNSVAMLMTESIDNFISSSRTDFVDPRYRAVSLAELFPEGYRRWLANNLTNDDRLKGPRVVADATGSPLVDDDLFPSWPIGWTSWWGETPRVCFPADGTTICSTYDDIAGAAFHADAPDHTAILDPQVGWEQQKFLIAWTMLYLPENEMRRWLDLLEVWELGRDADPGFAERIELHDPYGRVYVARTFGKETIFGREVQRGVAARVLEYANELVAAAFVTTPGPDLDADGAPDWHIAVVDEDSGRPLVRWDSTIRFLDADGRLQNGIPGCNEQENHACTCSANRACVELERYVSVPRYLREALDAYGLGHPRERGIYD